MALEDIEKLKEKVVKDPNSKLFVPLADEYRKAGMFDEAISVLLKGLDNQPGYMSARVSLGKVYLEKKMVVEAKAEFERVISAIPDNLFAHKKLAEICKESGDTERAILEYKTVLRLNSLDEDAMSNLEELQNKLSGKESVTAGPVSEELSVEGTAPSEEVEAVAEVEEEVAIFSEEAEEEISEAIPEDEFEEFKKSITERGEEAEEAIAEEVIAEEIVAEEASAEEAIAEEDINIEEAEKEALSYIDIFKETEPSVAVPSTPSFEMLLKKGEAIAERPLEKEDKSMSEHATSYTLHASSLQGAELFISDGNYSQAMKIYREMLSVDPGNKHVLQKVEELRMLLKMLGKEQEMIIGRLEAFAGGLKKRKDEFLRNP